MPCARDNGSFASDEVKDGPSIDVPVLIVDQVSLLVSPVGGERKVVHFLVKVFRLEGRDVIDTGAKFFCRDKKSLLFLGK